MPLKEIKINMRANGDVRRDNRESQSPSTANKRSVRWPLWAARNEHGRAILPHNAWGESLDIGLMLVFWMDTRSANGSAAGALASALLEGVRGVWNGLGLV